MRSSFHQYRVSGPRQTHRSAEVHPRVQTLCKVNVAFVVVEMVQAVLSVVFRALVEELRDLLFHKGTVRRQLYYSYCEARHVDNLDWWIELPDQGGEAR